MAKKRIYKPRKPHVYRGFPLVDATKDMEIEITKHDVSKADKKKPENCAAAVACKRMLNTEVEVHISRTYVKDNKNKRWIRFMTPQAISREITSFDRGSSFEPGSYVLKAATGTAKLGNYVHKSKNKNKSSGNSRPRHITANIRESAK